MIRGVKIGARLSPGGDGGTFLTYPNRIKSLVLKSRPTVVQYFVFALSYGIVNHKLGYKTVCVKGDIGHKFESESLIIVFK